MTQQAAGTFTAPITACLHCGTHLAPTDDRYCCHGCEVVHRLLGEGKLEQYYELRGGAGVPVPDLHPERRDRKWLDAIESQRAKTADLARVELDVQGIHCSACIWLIETLFRRRAGAVDIAVNPARGHCALFVRPVFDLPAFAAEIEAFGYLLGPPLKGATAPPSASSALTLRMGICIALAMNAMIFAVSTYAGLRSGRVFDLFQLLNVAISCGSIAVGGPVFFRSAWQGLRRGVLHLDLPIALGILLAFGGSLVAFATRRASGMFVDTIDVFIALMLVGRWLQERVLEKNRLAILANDGVDGLLTRRVVAGTVATTKARDVCVGDTLVIGAGDLVPVDARLEDASASFSLDWINGESRARVYSVGDLVPAGAFLAGAKAVRVVAATDFGASALVSLLRTPLPRAADRAMSMPWWRVLARVYVALVLAAAAAGFAGWMIATGDLGRSLDVTTAVLVVTCPCAFGIAMPLAYDLVQTALRRRGLYVRSPGFLDRAGQVAQVVFDKTGTVTSGALAVRDAAVFAALAPHERDALATLVAKSTHPKSDAIARALHGAVPDLTAEVTEHPGDGLSFPGGGRVYRLGRPEWAARGSATKGDVVFAVDDVLLADIETDEQLRPDAKREIDGLRAEGYDVWLLSGDDPERVAQTARAVAIPARRAVGGQSAEGKARWLAAHDHDDVLMIGDGINDALVVARAFASGTPTIDRPFMAARSDFYFVTPGLAPISLALRAAKALARVRRRNLALAIGYNVVAVGLAYAGLMSPLLCAVFMPASSLTTIGMTLAMLGPRSRLWTS